jgi:hypothetical protein
MSMDLYVFIEGHSTLNTVEWQQALDARAGGHFLECASAHYSAAALVAKFNGRAFDPQDGKFLTFEKLRTAGNGCLNLAGARVE